MRWALYKYISTLSLFSATHILLARLFQSTKQREKNTALTSYQVFMVAFLVGEVGGRGKGCEFQAGFLLTFWLLGLPLI